MVAAMNEATSERYRSGPLQRIERIASDGSLGGSGIGSFVARFYWKAQDGDVTWVDFEIFECTATLMDGTEQYARVGADAGWDTVSSLDEAEPVAHGHVKWDGCMELDVTYSHFCSLGGMRALFAAIDRTRQLCAGSMPGKPVFEEYGER